MTPVSVLFTLAAIRATAGAPIDSDQVKAAQKEWADGIIGIVAKQKSESGDYVKALADQFVDKLYAYTTGSTVLLKVFDSDTHSSFCLARECAAAHVVNLSTSLSVSDARFENAGVVLQGDSAMAMGRCFYTGSDAVEKRLEYSFGFMRDNAGKLRISLLHISAPQPSLSAATVPAADAAKVVDEKTEASKETASAASSTPLTTASTTKVKTNDDGERGHILHHQAAGRPTKAPTEENSGSIMGSLLKIVVVVLILCSLAITALTAQVKARPGMTPSDKIAAGVGIFQRKVQGVTTGRNTILPSGYDKNV